MSNKLIADIALRLEDLAGATESANESFLGWWLRIALASEALASTGLQNANENMSGYMRRASYALAVVTDGEFVDPPTDQPDAYLWSMVTNLEAYNGTVGAGSIMWRLWLAVSDFNPVEPPLPATRLGAAFGDSRLDRGYGLNGGSASTVRQRFARGPQHWLAALSLGRVEFPNALDFAVGGNSIAESLATMDDDIAAAESAGAGFYVWLCGVNGIRANDDAPTTIADEEAAIAKLKATGKPLIVIDDWPGSEPTFATSQPQWDVHRALHAHRASYASDPAILYINGFGIMSDPDSATPYDAAPKAELYEDTYLHQSPRGAYALATPEALAAISGWFERPADPQIGVPDEFGHVPVSVFHEDFSAAFTAGAGSGGTGNMPTGWLGTSGQASGTTRTNSKATMDVDGETLDCLQVELAGTAPGTGFPYARVLERAFTVEAGQKFYARALGQMAAGAENLESFEMAFVNTGTETTSSLAWFTPGERIPGVAYSVLWQTEVLTVPAGATSMSIRFRTYFPQGATVAATLKIADFWLVEVTDQLEYLSNILTPIPGSMIFAPWQRDTLFQDAAGTIPVTNYGQPVGLMLDVAQWGGKSLAQMLAQEGTSDPLALPGHHATRVGTDAARPIYQQDSGGRPYLACDGSDDGMVTPSIDLSAYDKIGVVAGVRKLSDAAAGIVAEFSGDVLANNGAFHIAAPTGANRDRYQFANRGTAAAIPIAVGFAAPHSAVLTGLGDISGDLATLRVNGAQVAQTTTDQGTGNYGDYPLYLFRRGGSSLPFNGRFYGLIQHPGAPSADFIAQAEALLADKTGVTL